MKNILTLRLAFLSAFLCSFALLRAQVVNIPDSNFKAALLANAVVNTNGDGEIQTTEAAAYTGTLRVSNKNISDLTGIESFTGITRLWCDYNNLTSINVSANIELTTLRCDHNSLTALDVSNNLKLTDLRCYVNQIGSLNVHANTDLTVLLCFQNRLTELNLGLNENLVQLQCSFNNLTALDVSANHALTSLDTRKNQLTSLNVKNGNNGNISAFNTTNNPGLFCIQVDDPEYSEANWRDTDPRTFFSADCASSNAQFVNIPDANFKAALVNNPQINRNHDSEIQVSEASVFDGVIRVSSRNISDLTGIEEFTAIRGLECANNPLTALDVSHNTALNTLRCDHAGLTTLVLGGNPNLSDLRCYYNELTSMDLAGSTGLTTLWCFGNKLSTLDISNSSSMVDLRVNHNKLTSLVIGTQPHLETVYAYSNMLTALDVSLAPRLTDLQFNLNKVSVINLAGNSFLSYLNGSDNQLTTLSLAGNLSLRNLLINNNKLTTLDLRRNSQIKEFQASKNPLTALTLKTTNNRIITYFNTLNTPQLQCIEVDDPAWSQAHWPNVDPHSTFKTDCGWHTEEVVQIPDANFKAALVANSSINKNGDGEIQVSEASAYEGQINVGSMNIVDLTGIEAFTAVTILSCPDNQISSLYLDHNTGLTQLDASYNKLNVIWFGALPNLRSVDLNHNKINRIDLRELPKLWFLDINENELSTLNVSANPQLDYLGCAINKITSLDMSTNTSLRGLSCSQNQLTILNVKNGNNVNMLGFNAQQNPSLRCIQVDDPAWAEANWRNKVDSQAMFSADCGGSAVVFIPDPMFKQRLLNDNSVNTNGDSDIQVSEAQSFTGFLNLDACGMADATGLEAFTSITSLDVQHNNLTQLDVSANIALRYLEGSQNQLTSLKINAGLKTLYGYTNQISSLDLNGNNSLDFIEVSDNQIESVNTSSLGATLKTFAINGNPLTSLNVSAMTNLEFLSVSNTKITSIDVSANTKLKAIAAQNNPELTTINAKNGNNTNMELDATHSPKLRCVQVDDVAYAEANFYIDTTAGFSTNCNPGGDVVYIPDPNLKSTLLSYSWVNTNHDNEIQVSEAQAYDNYVSLSGKNISDPTGLEAFTAMKFLDISGNNLTSIDTRPNTALMSLECSYNQITELHWGSTLTQLSATDNQLTSIDLASTPGIEFVFFHNNPLGSLDVSQNTGLKQLGVKNTGLTSIDVSHNPNLEWLELTDNQITTLDVSANPLLAGLLIENNHIASIDLSANPNIYQLWCDGNQLTELDLDGMMNLEEFRCVSNQITTLHVGNAPKILSFDCSNNLITNLDFSGAYTITYLRIQNNRLTSLNMRSQGYAEEYTVDGTNNPDLHCIEVSDVAHAEEFWRNSFDPGVTFSTNCGSSAAASATMSVYPNPTTDKLTIESTQPVDRVHIFDATGGLLMGTQVGNTVDMSSFQKGVYVIRIQHGGNMTPVRIVKE